jgi:hypothetical protein
MVLWMRGGGLCDAGGARGGGNGPLHGALVQVVTANLAGLRRQIGSGRREEPLPRPLSRGARVLAVEGVRDLDGAFAGRKVGLVLRSNEREVLSERCQEGERQDDRSILSTLAVADEDLASLEIDVLDSELQRLDQAQATPVQKSAHDPVRATQAAEQRTGFATGEHDRQALGAFRVREIAEPRELPPQHDLVQEEQASQRLVLRGRADFPDGGEAGEECGDLGLAERLGMALVVKQDETANPTDVGLLGARALMARPQAGPDAVEEAWRPSI